MATKRSYRPRLETLEQRLLLSDSPAPALEHTGACLCPLCAALPTTQEGPVAADAAAGSTAETTAAGEDSALPVPAFSSLPGAAAALYLDFNGHFEAQWGPHSNVSTAAFDLDGNPATFSATELATMEAVWRYVAEDFAPFNLNVTTVEPPSFEDGVALRVALGGSSAWAGGTYGGLSYINSFTNSLANTAYVFPKNLARDAKTIADAAAHEAGHAFGLAHQRLWNGATKLAEYQTGPGDGAAPLLGNSYAAPRSLWWYGTTSSETTYQHDMDVLARADNGFGYRADDHGAWSGTATALTAPESGFSAGGLIERSGDVDYFSFNTGGGRFTFTVTVPAPYHNLDPRLEVRDAAGNLVAAADPASSFHVALTTTLPAGDYFLVVAGAGPSGGSDNHGFNVGHYTLRGGAADSAAMVWAAGLPWVNTRKNTKFAAAKKVALSTAGTSFVSDLHSLANVDYYKFKAPAGYRGPVTVTIDARDLSVLAPKLAVHNASFKRVARASGGAASTATLTLNRVRPGKVYYLVVDGPRDSLFGAGAYRLNVELRASTLGVAESTSSDGAAAPAAPAAPAAALALIDLTQPNVWAVKYRPSWTAVRRS